MHTNVYRKCNVPNKIINVKYINEIRPHCYIYVHHMQLFLKYLRDEAAIRNNIYYPLSNLAVMAVCGIMMRAVSVYIKHICVSLCYCPFHEFRVLYIDFTFQLLVSPHKFKDGNCRRQTHSCQENNKHATHIVQSKLIGRLFGVVLTKKCVALKQIYLNCLQFVKSKIETICI